VKKCQNSTVPDTSVPGSATFVFAGAGVQAAQFLKVLDRHPRTLVEGEELLQNAPRRCVNAQLQIAQGAAADAGTTGQIQAGQAENLGADGDQKASQRRRRLGAAQGAFAQMGVAQGVAFQRVGRIVWSGRHEAPLAWPRAGLFSIQVGNSLVPQTSLHPENGRDFSPRSRKHVMGTASEITRAMQGRYQPLTNRGYRR